MRETKEKEAPLAGTKIQLFGLMLMIVGIAVLLDPRVNLGGIEYLFIFGGLLLGIVGLWREG